MIDEPVLGPKFHEPFPGPPEEEAKLVDGIRNLVTSQPFAVLCTQGSGQPYGSVVAFATSQDRATISRRHQHIHIDGFEGTAGHGTAGSTTSRTRTTIACTDTRSALEGWNRGRVGIDR